MSSAIFSKVREHTSSIDQILGKLLKQHESTDVTATVTVSVETLQDMKSKINSIDQSLLSLINNNDDITIGIENKLSEMKDSDIDAMMDSIEIDNDVDTNVVTDPQLTSPVKKLIFPSTCWRVKCDPVKCFSTNKTDKTHQKQNKK